MTPQRGFAILELMNEIESAKEPIKEPPKESPKSPEALKEQVVLRESKIKKFYKVCAIIQNILLGTFPILVLSVILLQDRYDSVCCVKRNEALITQNAMSFVSKTIQLLILTSLLMSILFVVLGIIFYFYKTDKSKKMYRKKFIIRGVVGLMLIFIIYFIISIIANLFSGGISCLCSLPQF